jgi:hypothetical protein
VQIAVPQVVPGHCPHADYRTANHLAQGHIILPRIKLFIRDYKRKLQIPYLNTYDKRGLVKKFLLISTVSRDESYELLAVFVVELESITTTAALDVGAIATLLLP